MPILDARAVPTNAQIRFMDGTPVINDGNGWFRSARDPNRVPIRLVRSTIDRLTWWALEPGDDNNPPPAPVLEQRTLVNPPGYVPGGVREIPPEAATARRPTALEEDAQATLERLVERQIAGWQPAHIDFNMDFQDGVRDNGNQPRVVRYVDGQRVPDEGRQLRICDETYDLDNPRDRELAEGILNTAKDTLERLEFILKSTQEEIKKYGLYNEDGEVQEAFNVAGRDYHSAGVFLTTVSMAYRRTTLALEDINRELARFK